jgi:hypothetical protein
MTASYALGVAGLCDIVSSARAEASWGRVADLALVADMDIHATTPTIRLNALLKTATCDVNHSGYLRATFLKFD